MNNPMYHTTTTGKIIPKGKVATIMSRFDTPVSRRTKRNKTATIVITIVTIRVKSGKFHLFTYFIIFNLS
jgi:hypothetical protein